jgi:hypothetical protein
MSDAWEAMVFHDDPLAFLDDAVNRKVAFPCPS